METMLAWSVLGIGVLVGLGALGTAIGFGILAANFLRA